MNKISQRKVSAGLVERGVFFLAGSIFLAGCPGFANESRGISTNLASTFEISTQWRCPTAFGAGYDTFEVYLENTGSRQITFKSVSWNGTNVAFQTDEITWWQFYPFPQVNPNETMVFRANFQKVPGTEQQLVLTDSAGTSMSITVPQFRVPQKLIIAVTYTLNYDKVFIQFQTEEVTVQKVWLNGREISKFTLLKSAGPKDPDMLAFDTPFVITSGLPLHIKLKFSDGTCRQALVRALSGIMLDAYSIGTKERVEVQSMKGYYYENW